MKTGLILEGGAMRGLFSSGVLDVFMENGIEFDGAVGVSAGAVFGVNYKSRQIGRSLRYNKKYCNDKRYMSMENLIKTGNIFGEEFCYKTLPNELDIFDTETFAANPMEFYVTATNVLTGKAVYYKCSDGKERDIEWMRASASMPMVSNIVEIDGYKLLDGGIADSVPVRFFEKKGYDRNVVILTQPKGYVKKPNSLMPAMDVMYMKYPKLLNAIGSRHLRYNITSAYIDEQEEKGNLLVIRPDEDLGISRTENNPDELQRVYELGRAIGLKRLEELREYLRK